MSGRLRQESGGCCAPWRAPWKTGSWPFLACPRGPSSTFRAEVTASPSLPSLCFHCHCQASVSDSDPPSPSFPLCPPPFLFLHPLIKRKFSGIKTTVFSWFWGESGSALPLGLLPCLAQTAAGPSGWGLRDLLSTQAGGPVLARWLGSCSSPNPALRVTSRDNEGMSWSSRPPGPGQIPWQGPWAPAQWEDLREPRSLGFPHLHPHQSLPSPAPHSSQAGLGEQVVEARKVSLPLAEKRCKPCVI